MVAIDWNLVAVWAQAIANTVVLVLIWRQIKQANTQIIQNDRYEIYRRSWEFVRFYRDEVRVDDSHLVTLDQDFDPTTGEPGSAPLTEYMRHFYAPRLPLFALLNFLVEQQQVDEQLLFGYLKDDFNRFVELGVRQFGAEEFRKVCGARLKLLLTLWGSHVSSTRLLFGTGNYVAQ
ncbi:MAG TPA: hypothetical protein V6D22_16795 [Candidatus Obscuribacterales bacterium]